jgi:zinc transport system substrate-binding protein
VVVACGATDEDGAGSGEVTVVASFYPAFEAAARVGGDHASVTNLTPAGAEPHDLELSPRQVDRIASADVLLYLGDGFQPGVERAVRNADGTAIDLLEVEPAPIADDPHVWLDPTLMKRVVERTQAAYVEIDPANADGYQARGEAFGRELDDLDAAFRAGLQDCQRRVIVTAHDAFGYLVRRYGLVQEAVAGLSPESEPEPSRLSRLTDKVGAEGITTIFYETLVSPRVAETLAREAGVRTAVLNPLEGLTEEEAESGQGYVSVMRQNLEALRSALGCR